MIIAKVKIPKLRKCAYYLGMLPWSATRKALKKKYIWALTNMNGEYQTVRNKKVKKIIKILDKGREVTVLVLKENKIIDLPLY